MNARNGRTWAALLTVFVTLTCAGSTHAALTFYTDRPTWEAAIFGTLQTEDFESDTPGTYTLPYTTSSGVVLESVLGPISAFQIITNGHVDGTREIHVRDFSQQMRATFPAGARGAGFGFDWDTAVESWELRVGSSTVPLPSLDSGFLGVVDDTRTTTSFILTSSAGAQGGISVDNFAWGPGLDVYTDRASWQAAFASPTTIEDFESEVPGVYPLPYTTSTGCLFTEVLGTINAFQFLSGGLVNGSREMHVRDFGQQLACAFPGSQCQYGFGFDWLLGVEPWELRIGACAVPLSNYSSGFVGVVDPGGRIPSFILTSSAAAQGGISVDDLEFCPNGSVAVRKESWGGIKSLYR
jgi:hypothetical protein